MPDADRPIIEPLGRHHDRAAFSCTTHPKLENYVKRLASQDARRNLAATFVLTSPESSAVIGFYTLSACSVHLPDLPAEQIAKDKLPPGRMIPATLLGQLAVDDNHAGQGHGERLLISVIHRALRHADEIASYAVVVDAIDDTAAAFYRHFEFLPMPSVPHRLYLPMGTIAKLF